MSHLSPGEPNAPDRGDELARSPPPRAARRRCRAPRVDERLDLGVDPDPEEEHRDEEVADRRQLALDAVLRRCSATARARRRTRRRSGRACAASASSANASVNARASATSVPADLAWRSRNWKSRGANFEPERRSDDEEPDGDGTIPTTSPIDTEPSETSRTTTVRITSPSTSSATAAPSTVRASTVASARRSLNTRAVMPTLVAVSAAPMNSDWLRVVPERADDAEAADHRDDHADHRDRHRRAPDRPELAQVHLHARPAAAAGSRPARRAPAASRRPRPGRAPTGR